jgi:hypothetical protein
VYRLFTFVLLPVLLNGATLYVSAGCRGTTTTSPTQATCVGVNGDDGALANAGANFAESAAHTGDYYYLLHSHAHARSTGWYELTISTGPGHSSGQYLPCLFAQASTYRGSSSLASITFDGVVAGAAGTRLGELTDTCASDPEPVYFDPALYRPIAFGLPRLIEIVADAEADATGILGDAYAAAYFQRSMRVYDGAGALVSDATWSLTEVPAPIPEPGSLLLFGVPFVLTVGWRQKAQHRQKSAS